MLVFTVLKKNYTKLWQCLPQDYMKTVVKLQELRVVGPSSDKLSYLINLPTVDLINENILANLIILIKADTQAIKFCDIMEYLVDASSQVHIEILRNGNVVNTAHFKMLTLYVL